jgi:uncharacterized coiled-coil protein SlyX
MSPLTEKLSAILDDWDQLTSILADAQNQCASKDGTIADLQQTITTQQVQLNRQAAELAAMKSQLSTLQAQATAALLTAADPDDAKIKKRIETAFQSVAGKPSGPTASSGSGRPVSPTVHLDASAPAATPVRTAPVNGTGRLVIPGRPAVPGNGVQKPPPQPQPSAAGSVSGILSIAKGSQGTGAGAGSSRYSSSEEAS